MRHRIIRLYISSRLFLSVSYRWLCLLSVLSFFLSFSCCWSRKNGRLNDIVEEVEARLQVNSSAPLTSLFFCFLSLSPLFRLCVSFSLLCLFLVYVAKYLRVRTDDCSAGETKCAREGEGRVFLKRGEEYRAKSDWSKRENALPQRPCAEACA